MLCMGNKWWLRSEVLLEIFHHTHRKLTYPSESWILEFPFNMFSRSQVGKTTGYLEHWDI